MPDKLAKPYIQYGPVYFVPVLPQRLSFAVLAWRALRELQLDPIHDAVAVSLPESTRQAVTKGAKLLNTDKERGRIYPVYLKDSNRDAREFSPITPADGIIEAIRSCLELKIKPYFVDREIAPSSLLGYSCESDPGILDDELVLLKGPEWYLKTIQPVLSHPPLRWEPLSTSREAVMAERIRALLTSYRRIVFVCHAVHVDPIRTLLCNPAVAREDEKPVDIRLKEDKSNDAYKLLVLDDIPRLVEEFEKMRSARSAEGFTKLSALVSVALDVPSSGDPSWSIRNFRAFCLMAQRLAQQAGRNSPTLEQVSIAANNCFSPRYAERLRRYLLGYRDEIEVERVRPAAERQDSERVFSRSCNSEKSWYAMLKPPGILGNDSGKEENLAWPLCREFEKEMRTKALRIASGRKRVRTSTRFSGSLGHGIDVRRTINRLYHTGGVSTINDLYVKTNALQAPADAQIEEPVVWIFDANGQKRNDIQNGAKVIRNSSNFFSGFTSIWECLRSPLTGRSVRLGDRMLTIFTYQYVGRVMFCDPTLSYEQVVTINLHGTRTTIPLYREVDEILGRLDEQLGPGSDWQQLLIEGALRFARKKIVIVAPNGFVVPPESNALATLMEKTIDLVADSRFSAEEIWKLENTISVRAHWNIPEGEDRHSTRVTSMLTTQLGSIVAPDW